MPVTVRMGILFMTRKILWPFFFYLWEWILTWLLDRSEEQLIWLSCMTIFILAIQGGGFLMISKIHNNDCTSMSYHLQTSEVVCSFLRSTTEQLHKLRESSCFAQRQKTVYRVVILVTLSLDLEIFISIYGDAFLAILETCIILSIFIIYILSWYWETW